MTRGGHDFTFLPQRQRRQPLRARGRAGGRRSARRKILHVSGISQAISDSACDAVFRAIGIASGAG